VAHSILTNADIDLLMASILPRDPPMLIRYVSQTQFSIARHYGSITFDGHAYRYEPATDELIRADVDAFIKAQRKLAAKVAADAGPAAEQIGLGI
jgi:hypothetical protein